MASSSPSCRQTPVSRLLSADSCQEAPVGRLLSADSCRQTPVGRLLSGDSCRQTPVGRLLSADSCRQTPVGRLLSADSCRQTPVGRLLSADSCLETPVSRPSVDPPPDCSVPSRARPDQVQGVCAEGSARRAGGYAAHGTAQLVPHRLQVSVPTWAPMRAHAVVGVPMRAYAVVGVLTLRSPPLGFCARWALPMYHNLLLSPAMSPAYTLATKKGLSLTQKGSKGCMLFDVGL